MKILFVIGTLNTGGKERRLVELLSYLRSNTGYEMKVVLGRDSIQYPKFMSLGVPYAILSHKKNIFDIFAPVKIALICRSYKPDILHSWGCVPAFVSLVSVVTFRLKHINSEITSAPTSINRLSIKTMMTKINFHFSDIVLSNSKAGLSVFNPNPAKSEVIYNGLELSRFENLKDPMDVRVKYSIDTKYAVVMVASFTKNKDYESFVKSANIVCSHRRDVSFICVGGFSEDNDFYRRAHALSIGNDRVKFLGRLSDVEDLVNACDIGVLLSPNGEGISNAILEYMALGKPLIVNNAGGNSELIADGDNGFLLDEIDPELIARKITLLIDNPELCQEMGARSREIIQRDFPLNKMGKAFVDVYKSLLINDSDGL